MSSPDGRDGSTLFDAELAKRVASSLVLVAIALGSAWKGGSAFEFIWAWAGAAVGYEWMRMSHAAPQPLLAWLASVGLLVAGISVAGLPGACAAGALALTLIAGLFLARSDRDRLWFAAGIIYAAPIAIVPILVRNHPALGLTGILWMFAVIWATDIAAYFTGRTLGGPKLWPAVSPKKTWSGFIGGTTMGVIAACTIVLAMKPDVRLLPLLVASLVASVAGQGGDLAESALKRHFGVKDSSQLIPGHGGFMDRLDAFWAVCLLVGIWLAADRFSPF